VAIKGSLDTISLSGIIQLLCEENKSGLLRVENDQGEFQIIFREGNIVYAIRPSKNDLLGDLLKQDGRILENQVQHCLKISKEKEQALGKTLVEEGYITPETLAEYLYKQIEDVLFNLFMRKRGEFEYTDEKMNLDWLAVVNINTLGLIINAANRLDEAVSKIKKDKTIEDDEKNVNLDQDNGFSGNKQSLAPVTVEKISNSPDTDKKNISDKPPSTQTASRGPSKQADTNANQEHKQPNVTKAPAETNQKLHSTKKFSSWTVIILALLSLIGLGTVFILFYAPEKSSKNKSSLINAEEKIPKPHKEFLTKKIVPSKENPDNQSTNDSSNRHPDASHLEFEDSKHESVQLLKERLETEIKEFLFNWKTAWENSAGFNGETGTYMSFYSDDFYGNGLDKNGWVSDKATKNKKKKWIRVDLKKIRISEPLSDQKVQVNFLQDYRSSNFTVSSEKTLILRKESTGWKIIGFDTERSQLNWKRVLGRLNRQGLLFCQPYDYGHN